MPEAVAGRLLEDRGNGRVLGAFIGLLDMGMLVLDSGSINDLYMGDMSSDRGELYIAGGSTGVMTASSKSRASDEESACDLGVAIGESDADDGVDSLVLSDEGVPTMFNESVGVEACGMGMVSLRLLVDIARVQTWSFGTSLPRVAPKSSSSSSSESYGLKTLLTSSSSGSKAKSNVMRLRMLLPGEWIVVAKSQESIVR